MNNNFSNNTLRSILLMMALMITTNASAVMRLSEHIYAGIGLTQSNLKLNKTNVAAVNNLGGQATLDNNGFGMDAYIGIKFDEHIALEMGYVEMGSTKLDDGTTIQKLLDANSLYLDAVLSHSVNNWVDIFAKGGVSIWEVNNVDTSKYAEGEGLHYGAGFNINIYGNKDRVLRVKWEHHEFDNIILESTDSVSISMMFNF